MYDDCDDDDDDALQRMKKKAKGGQQETAANQEDRWMSQIIVADTLLCQAVLTFMGQDIPSYMKGLWTTPSISIYLAIRSTEMLLKHC